LASKLYGIITGFNSGMALSIIMNRIIDYLAVLRILVVIYLNLRLLYKYLVKLGTIDKKRLIIDIMSFKELYKKKEISEV
jgi:hypothetical protein